MNFRSRLEAKWAAFFDICGWKWIYEPFDLDGWAPDFLIKTPHCNVLVEVKPVDMESYGKTESNPFDKAYRYWPKYQVMLLGTSPNEIDYLGAGWILDPPDNAKHTWCDVSIALEATDLTDKWREAGNNVQWNRVAA